MGQAIGAMLPAAVGVAVGPMPIGDAIGGLESS